MDLLIHRVRNVPLLVVITHRPEFPSRWSHHGHVSALSLSKLTCAQSSAIVSRLAGGKALPADLFERILGKTDGVPRFVEELTKSLLESAEPKLWTFDTEIRAIFRMLDCTPVKTLAREIAAETGQPKRSGERRCAEEQQAVQDLDAGRIIKGVQNIPEICTLARLNFCGKLEAVPSIAGDGDPRC
jgi:hypothetical protein